MKRIIENLKVWLWMLTKGRKIRQAYDALQNRRAQLRLHDSWDTIKQIVAFKSSISRFGDGELQIMHRYLSELEENNTNSASEVDTFQKYNKDLGKRLWEIWQTPSQDNMLIAVPYAFKDSSCHPGYARYFFERETLLRFNLTEPLALKQDFYDTNFTRFYLERCDIKNYPKYISELKKIWDNRDILFVEGSKSRLGVGNDLFNNAKSIRRLLCPATGAWDKYAEILAKTLEYSNSETLVLIALGQTATVLAYDLAQSGIQAIDLGHVDIEYEWYRMGATTKVPIPGKYVNEASGGRSVSEHPEEGTYQSEIIDRID